MSLDDMSQLFVKQADMSKINIQEKLFENYIRAQLIPERFQHAKHVKERDLHAQMDVPIDEISPNSEFHNEFMK